LPVDGLMLQDRAGVLRRSKIEHAKVEITNQDRVTNMSGKEGTNSQPGWTNKGVPLF
jgi:hypothetical protein